MATPSAPQNWLLKESQQEHPILVRITSKHDDKEPGIAVGGEESIDVAQSRQFHPARANLHHGFEVSHSSSKVRHTTLRSRRSHRPKSGWSEYDRLSAAYNNRTTNLPDRGGDPLPIINASSSHDDGDRDQSTLRRASSSLVHLPLDLFPIQLEGQAKIACRYYIEVYLPAAFRRPHFQGLAQDRSLLRELTPFMINSRMTFAALLARAMLQHDLVRRRSRVPSMLAMQAYGLALHLLRNHLQSAADNMSDLVLCTIMFLVAFDNMANHPDRTWTHVTAVKEIVSRRGGLDKLGFDGWLATSASNFIAHTQSQQLQAMRGYGSAPPQTSTRLEPLPDPIPPGVLSDLAQLSPAMRETCIRERLVVPVIAVLAQMSAWSRAAHRIDDHHSVGKNIGKPLQNPSHRPALVDANRKHSAICFMLLQNPNLPVSDQLVVMALRAYCVLVDDKESSRLNLAMLQTHADLFHGPNLNLSENKILSDAQWLTWVACMLLAASHTDSLTWSLGMRILDLQTSRGQSGWLQRLELCEKYLWEKDFSFKVMEKLVHVNQNPSVAGGKFSYFTT